MFEDGEMSHDKPSGDRHADLAKRRADLAAIHASLDLIESELLAEQVRRELGDTRRFRRRSEADREDAEREARRWS
jgi:hypothetical protein